MIRNTIAVFAVVLALTACRKQEMRDVPDVTRNPTFVTDAITRMQASGFRTRLETRQNETIAPGFVLDVSPRTPIPPGSLVTLTVAARDRDPFPFTRDDEAKLSDSRAAELRRFYLQQVKYPVPDVESERVFVVDAIRRLQGHGFRVAVTTTLDPKQKPGTVVDQLPPPQTELRWGSSVTIYATATKAYEARLSDADAERLSQATADTLKTTFDSMPPAVTDPPVFIHVLPLPIKPQG